MTANAKLKVIKVAHKPPFSARLTQTIRSEIYPSMIAKDGSTAQYETIYLRNVFFKEASEEDKQVFADLFSENIDFVEV